MGEGRDLRSGSCEGGVGAVEGAREDGEGERDGSCRGGEMEECEEEEDEVVGCEQF